VIRYACDGCSVTARPKGRGMALPLGWSKLRKFGLPTLHLCPACSPTKERQREEGPGLRPLVLADSLL